MNFSFRIVHVSLRVYLLSTVKMAEFCWKSISYLLMGCSLMGGVTQLLPLFLAGSLPGIPYKHYIMTCSMYIRKPIKNHT